MTLKPRIAPKFARRRERRYVTIGVGVMLGAAAILCADSQEVVSDYAKTTTQKIRTLHCPQWRVGVLGAGDSACIDLFQEEIWRKFPLSRFDYGEMVRIIRETVREIHEQHVWPRQGSSNPPSFQMLIALQGLNPGSRGLLYSQDSVVLPVDGYKSIGIGAYLSDYLHERLYPNQSVYQTPTDEAARIEVSILDEVKSAIHGCDGETLVAIFHGDGTFRWLLGQEVEEIESWFRIFHGNELPIFQSVANPEMNTTEFEHRLRQFEADVKRLRVGQARDAQTHKERYEAFVKAQTHAMKKRKTHPDETKS